MEGRAVRSPFQVRMGNGDGGNRDQTLVYFRTIGFKRLVTSSATFIAVGGEAPKKKTVA